MAAAGADHHVAVLAQDDVVAAVVVEHGGGAQFGGRAARLGDRVRLQQVHLAGRGRRAEGKLKEETGRGTCRMLWSETRWSRTPGGPA